MFYKLKVRADAKRAPESVLGFPVDRNVSTYVETTRDLADEAAKKKVKTVEVTAIEQLPERGEDGNNPRLFKLGDHQSNVAFEDETADDAKSADSTESTDEAGSNDTDPPAASDVETKQYRVLKGEFGDGVEYPEGVLNEEGALLQLTDVEAAALPAGSVELVDNEKEPDEEE